MSELSGMSAVYYNEEELEGIRIEDAPIKKEVYRSVERLRGMLTMIHSQEDRQKLSEAIDRLQESFEKMEEKHKENLLLVGELRK